MTIYPKNPLQYKLYDSCEKGHLGLVAHLIEDKRYILHIDVAAEDYSAFLIACKNKNKNLVKYFLTLEGVKESLIVQKYLQQHDLVNL